MEVRIEILDHYGRGITHINNKICFVENTLENEICKIKILNEKNKFIEAKTETIKEKSSDRIEEECPYSNICGGCFLNHMTYKKENEFKENKIKNIIEKYTSISPSKVTKIKYKERDYYRNKITLHGNSVLGYKKEKTNEIVKIDKCLIANKTINKIIDLLKDEKEIEEIVIKTSNDENNIMISITGKTNKLNELLEIANVLRINNEYKTKEKTIINQIGNKKYYEGLDSFFQINKDLTKELYDEIVNYIKDKKYKNVLDLYCGTGTIGIYLSDYVEKIIGVDNNKSNIEDANNNKKLNNCNNIEFICNKVENVINIFKDIELIVVDPPRKGLDDKTRNYLKTINPKSIIYVSCDPITLARDLNILNETYEVKTITPFNMFPRSYHCESVAVLERK